MIFDIIQEWAQCREAMLAAIADRHLSCRSTASLQTRSSSV